MLFAKEGPALAAAASALAVLSRFQPRPNKLTHSASSTVAQEIIRRCPSLQQYQPTPFLISGIVQTVSPGIIGDPYASVKFTRETIYLEDTELDLACAPRFVPGGEVSLDWFKSPNQTSPPSVSNSDSTDTIALLVPGITGCSESEYIRGAARELGELPATRCCVYNPRGRAGNTLSSPFLYSCGFTGDLRRVVQVTRMHVRNPPPPDSV
jgi:predicted alpha/beta-fold hydrolase